MRRPTAIRRLPTPADGHARTNVVGERVRAARQMRQPPLSLEATSQRILDLTGYDIKKHALVQIENQKRSCLDYELVAIAHALHVSPLWLLGLTDDPIVQGITWPPRR